VYIINATNSRCALDNSVQDWLHVRRRAADDAEHFGSRRLMLQRLAQCCVALLDFLEQADIFDRNNGLIGKGFEECNLFIGKGANF